MKIRFKKELESSKRFELLNQSNLSESEIEKLPVKYGVRMIVVIDDNSTILIKNNEGYHTLVGGHIEGNESLENGAIRECLEESGYTVSSVELLGYIEHINNKRKKFDFCFWARASGEPQKLNLTREEIKEGHVVYKYLIDNAIEILENDAIKFNKSISLRSAIFLKETKKHLSNEYEK